jgi:hypothetical protein
LTVRRTWVGCSVPMMSPTRIFEGWISGASPQFCMAMSHPSPVLLPSPYSQSAYLADGAVAGGEGARDDQTYIPIPDEFMSELSAAVNAIA